MHTQIYIYTYFIIHLLYLPPQSHLHSPTGHRKRPKAGVRPPIRLGSCCPGPPIGIFGPRCFGGFGGWSDVGSETSTMNIYIYNDVWIDTQIHTYNKYIEIMKYGPVGRRRP